MPPKRPKSWQEQLAEAAQQTGIEVSSIPSSSSDMRTDENPNLSTVKSPRETLKCIDFSTEASGKFNARQPEEQKIQSLLKEMAKTEHKTCHSLYDFLNQRTEALAEEIIEVHFPARLRVGGIQGFRERLLPALHPVYGVPYVPASSIKGIVRAWARQHKAQDDIHNLFGFLKQDASPDDLKQASLGKVQILDAFPTNPCLSLDVATPQWNWKGKQVEYGPSPHYMMSLENVTLKIGLVKTGLGSEADVKRAKKWLETALLQEGLGSRISAGYGQANKPENLPSDTDNSTSDASQPVQSRWRSSSHSFELWSQGIYSTSNQVELRSVAIRGMLRYWFRAVALSFCSPQDCQKFEAALFGSIDITLNPDKKPTHGTVRISVDIEGGSMLKNQGHHTPYHAKGTIYLESLDQGHLTLMKYILRLAMHLGGIGRGARRPLHYNSGMLRGCYWEVTDEQDRLGYESKQSEQSKQWFKFLANLKDTVQALCKQHSFNSKPGIGSPGNIQKRYQDVLNKNARIYLIKADKIWHPSRLVNKTGSQWPTQGNFKEVRGPALEFLYNSGFKGGTGNPYVGGNLGTPSFVWIQANNLQDSDHAYQAITLFGVDDEERQAFVDALEASSTLPEFQEIQLPWVKTEVTNLL